MKGIIFSELLRWVEEVYSPVVADSMIGHATVPNDGAYTSVGNYPHGEALALLVSLSGLTGEAVDVLARAYGRWLSKRFVVLYPDLLQDYGDVRSLLRNVETHIHAEVRKIYPEANPPLVNATDDEEGLRLDYSSHRPFADIALGLIEGFIAHFGEDLSVTRADANGEGTSATFLVR